MLRQLFAWHGVPVKIVDDGMKLFATGTFVHVCSGLSIDASILAAGGIMLLYTFLGGVWAVSVTDFVQFVVLTAGILVVLPLSIAKAGGLTAIVHNSPEGFFRLTAPGYSWGFVLPVVLMYCLAWSSINWSLIQRYYCVPTEKDAVKVGWLVIGLYMIGPPLMFFPAIAARQLPLVVDKVENVYPILCANLLPAGMLGLAIAAMFSATMSTLSGDFNVCASVLTNDVYLRLIRPKASQRELVFVGRAMTLLVGVVALATALIIARSGNSLFDIMVTLFALATAPVAIPMLLGLVSKRVTNRAALLGFIGGTLAGIALFLFSKIDHDVSLPCIHWMPDTTGLAICGLVLKMEAWIILVTALVTFTIILVVSAISPIQAEALQRVEAFYRRLATPIGDLEEDRATTAKASYMLSPFRVVGACVFLIGLLMLAIVPWIHESLAVMMDAGLALALMLIGAVWFRSARRTPTTQGG
jgi:Na+/proline symporter